MRRWWRGVKEFSPNFRDFCGKSHWYGLLQILPSASSVSVSGVCSIIQAEGARGMLISQ